MTVHHNEISLSTMLNEKSQAKACAGKDAETLGIYTLLAGV